MGRIERKVDELLQQDASMREPLEFLLEHDGAITWGEASDEMSSGEWGRLIEKGILTDAGEGFELADAGDFGPDDDVAVILTGSGYKYGPPETGSATAREIDREDVPDAIDGVTS